MIRSVVRVAVSGLCLLSLLICAGAGWLWWRSYHARDAVEFRRGGELWEAASSRGRLKLDNLPQVEAEEEQIKACYSRLWQDYEKAWGGGGTDRTGHGRLDVTRRA